MHHHPQPEKIELTSDEFNKIESEIKSCNLSSKTKELILKALHFMVWLQGSLEHANTALKKVKLVVLFQIEKEKSRLKNKLYPLIFKLLLTLLMLHLAIKMQ